tara:strand:+ start:106 stop:381 length:276 start_codon:yes stop_codon:yes gene_type:complete
MKVKELMERAGITQTGRAIAYIKDALEEINFMHDTHIRNVDIAIVKDQREYNFPNDMLKVVSIQCKNHLNTKDEYRHIPRLLNEPLVTDKD